MSLDLFIYAPIAIQLHVIAALCAVIIGPMELLRRSRDRWHKNFGYAWVITMAVTALSSFAIKAEIGPGPISPIHLLSVFTLLGLWKGFGFIVMAVLIGSGLAWYAYASRKLAVYD